MRSSPPDPELLALNAATVREKWSLREAITGCVRHRIRGISPWRKQLGQMGLKEAAKAARDSGLTVTGLCGGGPFPASDRKARQAAIDDTRRAIDEAATLEARCLVLVAGGLPEESKDLAGTREMVRDGIGEVLDQARSAGVPLAIEPVHPMHCASWGCVNTLAQALDLCDELDRSGSGALGVAVDVYHVWWDPQLKAQIERAGDKRLLAFQISDWLPGTRDLLADRGMMGDGVIDLPLIRSWMEQAGYRGFHEVEILSSGDWWRRDPDEVLASCRVRHQTAC
jgi:sugar phosphate isomerase/epimerase